MFRLPLPTKGLRMKARSLKLISIALFMIGLSGCATPLPDMSADFLCQHFGENNQDKTDRMPAIRAEIQRRNLLSAEEQAAVDQGILMIGMSRCGMFAVQGIPSAENSTTTASGTFIQHVFFNSRTTMKREYVYTQNSRVTSWQK
jgi:hypothetical protein